MSLGLNARLCLPVRRKQYCHSNPFAVILSAAKALALGAQGKLRQESRPDCFFQPRNPILRSDPAYAERDSSLRSE